MAKRYLYKLTEQDRTTWKHSTLWGKGVTHEVTKPGAALCTSEVIHAYTDKNLALLMNPSQANIKDPVLFLAFGEVVKQDSFKVGVKKLTTRKEIELPLWYTGHNRLNVIARFAQLCAKEAAEAAMKAAKWSAVSEAKAATEAEAAEAWASATAARAAAKAATEAEAAEAWASAEAKAAEAWASATAARAAAKKAAEAVAAGAWAAEAAAAAAWAAAVAWAARAATAATATAKKAAALAPAWRPIDFSALAAQAIKEAASGKIKYY